MGEGAIEIAGRRLAWRSVGGGAPLLLVNGYAATAADWDPAMLARLSRSFEVICPDNRGMGDSELGEGELTVASMAADLLALLDELELDRLPVAGWSMGGFVAQRLAIDHPGRVSGLVLAGTNPGGPRTALGTRRAQRIDSEPNPPLAAIMRELYPRDRQREGRRFLRRLDLAARDGEVPDDFHVAARTTDRQVAAEDPWLRSGRNYRQLAAISVPTLAAAGSEDPVVPPVNLRRIAARIPGARFEAFAGAHAFLFQDRRRFARALAGAAPR